MPRNQTTLLGSLCVMRRLEPADLPAVEQLLRGPALHRLPSVRWHLRTPYAVVKGLFMDGVLVGVACGLHFASTARITHLYVHPQHADTAVEHALAANLLATFTLEGDPPVLVHSAPERQDLWRSLGFTVHHVFMRFQFGEHIDASMDEVLLLEPAHALALMRLDQRATGEDRRALLLEHRFAAQAFVEEGRFRGALLPLLGHGLILADVPHVGLELQRWLLPHQAHIIVPAANTAACAHLQVRGYASAHGGVQLVRGAAPPFQAELVFAWPWG